MPSCVELTIENIQKIDPYNAFVNSVRNPESLLKNPKKNIVTSLEERCSSVVGPDILLSSTSIQEYPVMVDLLEESN